MLSFLLDLLESSPITWRRFAWQRAGAPQTSHGLPRARPPFMAVPSLVPSLHSPDLCSLTAPDRTVRKESAPAGPTSLSNAALTWIHFPEKSHPYPVISPLRKVP